MTSTNLGSIHGFHDEPPQFQGGVSIVRGDPPLPPVFQVGTPLLQGDPPKLQILLSCLELASTAPDFSLSMNVMTPRYAPKAPARALTEVRASAALR